MKVAIIGCGKQAPKHISGYKACGVTEFVVSDVNKLAAKRLADECAAQIMTTEEIMKDDSIRAVSICTPVQYHKPIIEAAIASGKHFFCEKPLSLSLQDDIDIEALALKSNIVGMVGYIYRFSPVLFEGKKILNGADCNAESQALGKINSAFFRIGGRGSHMPWKHKRSSGGGAISEMAVHMLDLAVWYFGEIDSIDMVKSEIRQESRIIDGVVVDCDAEDWVLCNMTSKSGVNILLQADMNTPAFTQYVEVQGSKGTYAGSIQSEFNSYLFLSEGYDSYSAGRNSLSSLPNNLFESQMAVFLKAVQSSSQPERCSLSDSVVLGEALFLLREHIAS